VGHVWLLLILFQLHRFAIMKKFNKMQPKRVQDMHVEKGHPAIVVTILLSLLFHAASVLAWQPQAADTQTLATASGNPGAAEDHGWHFSLSPYLWFAGAHGTAGALGHDVSIHASPADLLSHFDIGLMGAAAARRRRFLLDGDLLWIRISDSKALPSAGLGAVSADARLGQLVWTSKLGYRLIDSKKVKADANVGARFWHVGQKLSFNPSTLGLNFNGSQNWADVVIGGRVQLPIGEKAVIDTLGDVGGWGATSQLDYQFAALLGYKIHPKWTLLAGYRYLFVDYRPGSSVLNMVTSGALLGATFKLK
jgi:hypothetical protein